MLSEPEFMNRTLKVLRLAGRDSQEDLVTGELRKAGVLFEMKRVTTDREFRSELKDFAPDLILADYSLASDDGVSVLRFAVKEASEVPFIFVSETLGEEIAIEALKQGASDYVLKQRLERLVPAVRRALREATERKQPKQTEGMVRQRESEERYRSLFDRSLDCVYVHDFEGNFLDANPAALALFGYELSEISTINIRSLLSPEQLPKALQTIGEIKAIGVQRQAQEFRFQAKNGRWVDVEIQASVLVREGKPFAVQGIARDLTQRKRIEERIRQQATMLDLAHDAIIVRDLEDRIVYWNESAGRLYGWTVEEALGRKATEILGDDVSKAREVLHAVLERDEWNGELTQTTKTGGTVLVEARFTLIRDRQGHPTSILAINTNVTERKKLEMQFLRAQRMESIGTLAGGIAHDLNNVLAPIMMSCQLLDLQPSDEDRKRLVEMIRTSTKRGADLVKQVLAFCRGVEGRRLELAPKHLIKEVHHILVETFPKSIRFETDVAKDLWTVAGDPTQLHQVLLNLCVNARDAMPQGGQLTIRAENLVLHARDAGLAEQAKPGPYVVISAIDTGTGIPAEIRAKLFTPFFTTKEVGKGTGLGLSTSLTIVKSHGGFIDVSSEPGKGSVFKVHLPALSVSNVPAVQLEATPLPRGNGELVLVVDDEAFVRMITTQTLQTFGYQTMTANNGAEAVALYRQHVEEIAVVIMDIMMPVMNGSATIDSLLRINPQLKVIAASGLGTDGYPAQSTTGLVKALLPKPYTSKRLLTTLHEVLHGGLTTIDQLPIAT